MRACHCLSIILLAILSRVSAERTLHQVFATVPNDSFLENVTKSVVEPRVFNADENTRPMQDVEVTGFITKHGDIFELSESQSMGSIEAREDPELEPGMTMCRFGSIVVYSDTDCNTFFRPSQNLGAPVKTENKVDVEKIEEKPLKKKKKTKKTKANRRKSNKNKTQKRRKNKKNKKRKNPVRRKVLKQGLNKRRNNLNQKRRKNLKKQRKQKRGNKERKRISDSETRSNSEPMQFAILYERL